jgi:threonine dehydrogenase-like Zn-dependent dehydrogenase
MTAPVERTGIAVYPGQAHTLHLTSVALPPIGPTETLISVKNVGICGTDREIIEGKFGTPPPGANELILGHEVLGVVSEVGSAVSSVKLGDIVVPTVRRPCTCPPCQTNQADFCLTRGYVEHGIIGLHGFMVEQFVSDARHLVVVPPALAPVGVLLEPLSVVEKALRVARAVQARLSSWQPETALIFGAGPIGLLGTMLLRAEGMEVYTVARSVTPNRAAELIEATGAHYISTREQNLSEVAKTLPNIDLIFESSGNSQPVVDGMTLLGSNGVLVLLSLTGGDARIPVPADLINREFVLGNKVMVGSVNSHRDDFVAGLAHLERFAQRWPGLTERLITHRFAGFEDALRMMEVPGIKSIIEVS